ncbi:MAG: DUF1048 domain-containing protein [Clostridium sp.]|nr:DUF1048 domain-containing protein [Clostridium sp.]MCM1460290.1 DUF1048 domain-containing protein [Bacteroides sp.]
MDYTELSQKLEGEYRRVFDEVEAYAIIKNYAGEGKEELMMNLLDMLLTAQEEGKEAEKIVGNDVRKFCKDYFTAYDKKQGRLEQICYMLSMYAWLGVFNCCLDLFDDDMKFVGLTAGAKTDWTVLICCLGVAIVVSEVLDIVLNVVYRNKPAESDKLVRIILLVAVVSGIIGLVVAHTCNLELLLPLVPTMIICITVIAIGFICKRIKNYKQYGSVWAPKEEKIKNVISVSDDDGTFSEYEQLIIGHFSELYDKKNAKRRKKKEPAMTKEEFMDFLEKENGKLKRDSKRMPILWGILCIITTVTVGVAGGFKNFADGAGFFGILAGSMFVVYYFIFAKFFYGKILRDRMRLFEKCRRDGKTVLDYVKEKE